MSDDTISGASPDASSPVTDAAVKCFGKFSRAFSGTRSDLWCLALDPSLSSRPCVTDGSSGLSLTYQEFAGHAARLAIKMAALGGVSHDTTVAVSMPRSAAMATAMWACHLAGCIYTPINATLPALSKRYILENTRTAFFICSAATLPEPDAVPEGVHIIVVDTNTLRAASPALPLSPSVAAPPSLLPPLSDHDIAEKSLLELQQLLELALNHRATQPGDTAYYIHTSGSTGKPKCVVHVHSSLDWHSHVTLLGSGVTRADDVCLQVADCSFDLHIRDIFCFISTGGHVVTIPPAALTDMLLLCDLFRRYSVTWLECVPLIFSACVEHMAASDSWSHLSALRVWSCIGAPFQIAPARVAAKHLPNLQFYNSYAPTENCLVTTMHRVTQDELSSSDKVYSVPIGKPVPGWQCFLYDDETDTVIDQLDEAQLLAGAVRSASGICYVRGPGVLQCYLNRDDLTQAAFLSKHDKLPVPLFRVGDVCHYNADGALVFEGRRDNQIKIQGQRMEPGEVEAVIQSFDGVSGSVVKLIKPVPDQPQHDFLCAYVNLSPALYSSADLSSPPSTLMFLPKDLEDSLISLCKSSLPKFMVPKVFLSCPVWPRTLSGKISRLDLTPPPESLLHELMLRRNMNRLLRGGSGGGSVHSEASLIGEAMKEAATNVRAAVATAMQLPAKMAASIDGDQPLLDVGMNSMQLTLLVSILRVSAASAFSIGDLLLLPVISINSIATMLADSSAPATSDVLPTRPTRDRPVYRADPLGSGRRMNAVAMAPNLQQSRELSMGVLSAIHVAFFCARLFVLDLLPPAFLYASFQIVAANPQFNSWTTSALYIAVAAAVIAACFLVVFVLLLRSVFSVSSIVDVPSEHRSNSRLPREGSLLLPLRSVQALRFWMAERMNSPVMWFISLLQGTELYNALLRLLGAKIGRGCVILCSIDVPSLVDLGDNCFIENGARLRCSQVVSIKRDELTQTALRVGRIRIGAGSYVASQATITQGVVLPSNSQVECDAYVCETNAQSVPVAPAPQLLHDSHLQRALQVSVLVAFWLLLLALSVALIKPWVNSASAIEASAVGTTTDTSSSSPLPLYAQPAGATVWYYVILFEIVIHPVAILALALFHLCIGPPPPIARAPPSPSPPLPSSSDVVLSLGGGLPLGSWSFFLHVVLRRVFIRTFGFPLYTLQSSYIPAAIMRACGARVGKRTIVFNYDYSVELQAPLQQLVIGDDCIVTTFVQLGNSTVRDGLWASHDVTVGSGCLLGNNSIIDTAGLPLPDNTWVSALSHVTSSSVAAAAARPHNALGSILCGNPTAAPFPVAPSTLLSSSSANLMHPIVSGCISCLWAFLLAPVLCPCSIEVLVVFFLVLNSYWTFSSMLLLIVCCEAGALLWSTLCLLVFERLSSRIVVNGAHYQMFTAKWWAFHWCDMFRARYISLWPQFFSDSPVFTWFMRTLLGARCGADVTISEPHLSEPALQSIGSGSVVAWNSWLQPHTYNGHTLILGSISVGSNCFIDSHAALLPDSTMEDGSCLTPVSLLMKGDRVEMGRCFGGVPARAVERDV